MESKSNRDYPPRENARAAAFRLRRQLGQTLRMVITETVTSSEEVEEELKSLIGTFSN